MRRRNTGLPLRNSEGYIDPTPYAATKRKPEPKGKVFEYDDGLTPLERALTISKAAFRRYGFEVVGRITLRNTETGEILR